MAILCLCLPVLVLPILDRFKSVLKFRWLSVSVGVILAFIFILLWQLNIPTLITLPVWWVGMQSQVQPALLVDSISWSYSLSLVSLAVAVILTAGIRQETTTRSWAFTLVLVSLGILAVSSANPLTLVLLWTAMDVFVLGFMLSINPGRELGRPMITSFSYRLLGTGIFLLLELIGSTAFLPVGFERISSGLTILVILAACLRTGIVPLGLLFPEETSTRQGLYTTIRLVFAVAGFAFLARLPGFILTKAPDILAFCLMVSLTLWTGWKWFISSSEIAGRTFWVSGFFGLVTLSSFITDPVFGTGLGVMLILSGAYLFLLSSREKKNLWLSIIFIWGLSTMPYSPAAGIWLSRGGFFWLLLFVILPSQSLLVSGFLRHLLRATERVPASREHWNQITYLVGLIFLCFIVIILGIWGWEGAARLGTWWASVMVIGLSALFFLLGSRIKVKPQSTFFIRQAMSTRMLLVKFGRTTIAWSERVLYIISSTLEGEGGIIWSVLLLVLILSLLTLGER